MTLQDFANAINNGGAGLSCPFANNDDDHYEVENTSEFFNVSSGTYSVTDKVTSAIESSDNNLVIFLHEVTQEELDARIGNTFTIISDVVKCVKALMEATEPTDNTGG